MWVDTNNKSFQAALLLLEETNFNVFLTGKAGTGKTTFLKYIKQHLGKKMAIMAPTGVAAINAGGMTIHSLFHIPPSVYPPNDPRLQSRSIGNGISIRSHFKMSRERKKLFKELELLIIDEISMVRCDLLDVVDKLLRTFGGVRHLPFGGKQVLFIGDPYQLPPVTPDEEWKLLQAHYRSPYFFSAHSWQEAAPKLIELRKVYRQHDQNFIDVLNRVRSGDHSQADLSMLNQNWIPPGFNYADEGYIYLGVTNRDVDQRNEIELKRLEGEEYTYYAMVSGDFKKADMPTPPELTLKVGAQVMFVKNDIGESRRYYNGKIGRILELTPDEIIVECAKPGQDETDPISVNVAIWRKIRYEWNAEEKQVDEIETGSYQQFPLKLAWAITVHKSQGLSFDQVYANLNGAFAAGQTYVALSRCTQLEGLKLATKLRWSDIKVDREVRAFSKDFADDAEIEALLDGASFLSAYEEVVQMIKEGYLALALEQLWSLKNNFPDYRQELDELKEQLARAMGEQE
jgi:ATP-dependent exoDNAse (exonuclease V) alpha subunit